MANGISAGATSSVDTKTTARSLYNGDAKELSKLTVQEQLDRDVSVTRYNTSIDKITERLDKDAKIVTSFDYLRSKISKVKEFANNFRKPPLVEDNAFERKYANVTSTEAGGEKLISVDALAGAQNTTLKVFAETLATNHSMLIGTEGLTLADAVNDAIQAVVTNVADAVAAALTAAGPLNPIGLPVNGYARSLYNLAVKAQATGQSLATLQALAQLNFDQMEDTGISDGFESLSSQCVGAGTKLTDGEYVLFSMAGSHQIATNIKNKVGGAKLIYDSINGIGAGPVTKAGFLAQIGGKPGIDYDINGIPEKNALATEIALAGFQVAAVYDAINAIVDDPITVQNIKDAVAAILVDTPFAGLELDGDGLPTNNDLAKAVMQAAIDQVAVDDDAALVKAAAGDISLANAKAAALEKASASETYHFADSLFAEYPENSDFRKNPYAKFILDKASKESIKTGATMASVFTALDEAYDEFKTKCTISLVDGDSLQTVIDKINVTTPYSGIQANAIEHGEGSYLLQVSSVKTGMEYRMNVLDTALNIADFTIASIKTQTVPANAEVTINGVYIESQSNIIPYSDKISITINGINKAPGEFQTVKIIPNTDVVFDYIGQFIMSYNELAGYIAQQKVRDSNGKYVETAVLGGHSLINGLDSTLSRMGLTNLGFLSGPKSLQDLGIRIAEAPADPEKNIPKHQILEIDDEKLKKAVSDDYESVRKIFEFSYETSDVRLRPVGHNFYMPGNNKLKIYIDPAGAFGPDNDKQVKIEILDVDDSVIETEYHDLSGVPGNYSIMIQNKTYPDPSQNVYYKLNGLSLSYKGTAAANDIEVSFTQGVADLMHGFLMPYVDDLKTAQIGTITKSQEAIAIASARMIDEKKRLETQLSALKDRLAKKIAFNLSRAEQAKFDTSIMEAYIEAQNAG